LAIFDVGTPSLTDNGRFSDGMLFPDADAAAVCISLVIIIIG